MFLVVLIAGVLILYFVNRTATHGKPRPCNENYDDKKHHWVVRFDNGDKRGYLICKTCGKIPGED